MAGSIDGHCHVGLVGDEFPSLGGMSQWYRKQLTFKIFLAFARIDPNQACDRVLRQATIETISTSTLDRVVCLALDPVYSEEGSRREDLSHVWVDNEYVLSLQGEELLRDRVLFAASVHPYDDEFAQRTAYCVERGAVMMKWLPSAQSIDLANPKAAEALIALAFAGPDGKPLPLLLHVGPEYAIPPADPRHHSYDYLSWSWLDRARNALRFSKRWHVPNLEAVHSNLEAALDAGAVITFAHCGMPYFASGVLGQVLEHSDFKPIKRYLEQYRDDTQSKGRCFADVSAFCTPFRKRYFSTLRRLPPNSLIYGSDFPTPIFEISADFEEAARDFRAILHGEFDRIVIPQDNLLDVSYRELQTAFPDHPMFTNLSKLLPL
ncbi:MAG: hypothetical protein GY906_11145 [bacterium]|nr:hypothetical protein [bacterium]